MGVQELILKVDQIQIFSKEVGVKSINLQKMFSEGYNVPKFVAVPSSVCSGLIQGQGTFNEKLLEEVVKLLVQELKCLRYVVRSSALIEDSQESSMAGQFKTEIDVMEAALEVAIKKVLSHAYDFLKGKMENFSLIIQEFIEAEYSGVFFTRDPQGGRYSVLEYHPGRGEELVSGKIQPKSLKFYADQFSSIPEIPDFGKSISDLMKLERIFGFAQDIEWCWKNGELFYVQSRPVTTITLPQYQQHLFLDKVLPQYQDYFYEKTEIAEIAPKPTPFTWSLLQKIYGPDGPVDKVYKKYGVYYAAEPFLVRIGNELFTDKEAELKNLLPAYSYFGEKDLKPHLQGAKSIVKTFKNIFALQKISFQAEEIFQGLRGELSLGFVQEQNFEESLKNFLRNYSLIFEINLLADKALKVLEKALISEKISISKILNSKFSFIQEYELTLENFSQLYGNALEISQEESFVHSAVSKKEDHDIVEWWNHLSSVKKPYFQKIITDASQYLQLREYGRWLTVKHINELRKIILKIADEANFQDARNIYFSDVDSIINKKINENDCIERKKQYDSYEQFCFPARLTNRISEGKTVLKGVSAGVTKGKLITTSEVLHHDGGILYTKILYPELTQYFGKISGIVSEQGGLLSHLAIMARENHLPVVVGFKLQESTIQLGEIVEIDGSMGTIKPADKNDESL